VLRDNSRASRAQAAFSSKRRAAATAAATVCQGRIRASLAPFAFDEATLAASRRASGLDEALAAKIESGQASLADAAAYLRQALAVMEQEAARDPETWRAAPIAEIRDAMAGMLRAVEAMMREGLE